MTNTNLLLVPRDRFLMLTAIHLVCPAASPPTTTHLIPIKVPGRPRTCKRKRSDESTPFHLSPTRKRHCLPLHLLQVCLLPPVPSSLPFPSQMIIHGPTLGTILLNGKVRILRNRLYRRLVNGIFLQHIQYLDRYTYCYTAFLFSRVLSFAIMFAFITPNH